MYRKISGSNELSVADGLRGRGRGQAGKDTKEKKERERERRRKGPCTEMGKREGNEKTRNGIGQKKGNGGMGKG